MNCHYNYFFLIAAIKRNNQPAIKDKPPNGVTGPAMFAPGMFCVFKNVRKYKEPEKRMMPIIKKLAAHFKRPAGNFSKAIATNNKARE